MLNKDNGQSSFVSNIVLFVFSFGVRVIRMMSFGPGSLFTLSLKIASPKKQRQHIHDLDIINIHWST